MARVHGVHLRKPPKGPSAYTSKEAALAASPTMVIADAAFPKNKMDSARNAAFRVNSGGRGDWSPSEFFGVWEYAKDVVLRITPKDKPEVEEPPAEVKSTGRSGGRRRTKAPVQVEEKPEDKSEGSVTVVGFVKDGEVFSSDDEPVGSLETLLKEEGVETGGWVLLIGVHPHVPEGWEEIVGAPGSRKQRRKS